LLSSSLLVILLLGLAGLGGFYGGHWYRKKVDASKLSSAEELSTKILENAKKEAETIKKEAKILAKDEILKAQTEFERESKERRSELQKMEKRLLHKEENLEKKMDLLDKKEIEVGRREKGASKREGIWTNNHHNSGSCRMRRRYGWKGWPVLERKRRRSS